MSKSHFIVISAFLAMACLATGCVDYVQSIVDPHYGRPGHSPRSLLESGVEAAAEDDLDTLYSLYDAKAHQFFDNLAKDGKHADGETYFTAEMPSYVNTAFPVSPDELKDADVVEEIREERCTVHVTVNRKETGVLRFDVEMVKNEDELWELALPAQWRTLAKAATDRGEVPTNPFVETPTRSDADAVIVPNPRRDLPSDPFRQEPAPVAPESPNHAPAFSRIADLHDKNKDGRITPDEMTDHNAFNSMDRNRDGVLTPDDFSAARPRTPVKEGTNLDF